MLPVLLTVGGVPISSFGFFLLMAVLAAAYFIWRIIRVYDFDEEKIIDLVLLTFLGGIVGARIYFWIFHQTELNDPLKIIMVNRYPGLSFWGALLGGIIFLRVFSRRFKLNFWQVSDYAVVGLFIGISISSIGCLLGSCSYGEVYSGFFGVNQTGLIGKRFPVQLMESLLFLLGFLYLWKSALKFHSIGQIASSGLILLGIFKFFLEFLRGDSQMLTYGLRLGTVWAIILFLYGVILNYRINKRSPKEDLIFIMSIFTAPSSRKLLIGKVNKSWYNFRVNFKIALFKWRKTIFKLLKVKSNPTQF